jgi:hypothetical protein
MLENTVIWHKARKKCKISLSEYVLCDMISKFANNEN